VVTQPPPVVFRPRPLAAKVIWAVIAICLALAIVVVVLTNVGLQLKPSPVLVGALVPAVVIALLNHARPLGLDRKGLHIGSADKGYILSWSNVTGVVTVPGNLLQPERIRLRMTDSRFAPGWWARRRWGVRVLPGAEFELALGHRQAGVEIATEIRHFIDAYGWRGLA
jgi:hypothetical protein